MRGIRSLMMSIVFLVSLLVGLHSHEPAEVVVLSQVLMDHLVTVDDAFLEEHVGGSRGCSEPRGNALKKLSHHRIMQSLR